jgi:hypothetical protein
MANLKLPNYAHNKLFLAGLGVSVAAGLYVLYQRQKNAPATAPGTTTAATDATGISAELQAITSALSSQNDSINSNLSGLITQSDQAFVQAINGQTAGITGLENAQLQQTTTVGTAVTDAAKQSDLQFRGLETYLEKTINASGNAIFAQNASLSKQLTDMVTAAFASIAPSLASLASVAAKTGQDVAAQAGTLNSLTQTLSNQQDALYLGFGLHSAAACWNSAKKTFDTRCTESALHDWPGEGGLRDFAGESAKYADCFRGDHYDLVCVGRLLNAQFGGATGSGGGGITR